MVIKKLKERIKSLSGNMDKDKIKQDLEEIETINIELDHKVTKLIAENEHLKQNLISKLYGTRLYSTGEEATVLRDLVNHIQANYPLDPTLESALKPSTRASRSQPSGNTKKDRILQTQSSTQKNKVEAHPRKVKYSLKNKDHVVAPKGTAHVQPSKLNANSKLKCVKRNGCMLFDNHDLCLLDYINNVNARAKCKSVKKQTKRKVWKPTGKMFTTIRYIWRPTGRTFTIVGNACPLTRITTTTEVPLRKPVVLDNETSKLAETLVYSRKPRNSKTNVPVSKSKVVQIVLWYLDSGCSKHMTGDRSQLTNFIGNVTILRVYDVEGLGHNLFSVGQFCDSNLEVAFRQHTCFIRNLEGVDLLTGSQGNNLYTLSLGDMMASSSICLLSKASKTKSKDEALDFIIKFLKMIQLWLKVPVRHIRTDNGTEFAKVVATACYTKNRSIICLRHGKTPYELLHDKLLELSFFHVFGALCYPTNDCENLGKLQPKADISIFIGYAPTKKAFRIYNQRTRRIIETIHVDFDELTAMASEHSSSGPALHKITPATISSGLVPNPFLQHVCTTFRELTGICCSWEIRDISVNRLNTGTKLVLNSNSYLRDILGDILGKDMYYPLTRFSPQISVMKELNHEDASGHSADTKQQQQVIPQTTAISNIKLPILKKEEYDIWAMEMEHYLEYIDNEVFTAVEIQAVEKERKAKNILLMAIPKEHMRRFHGMDDAKEIWEAIRTRFGGNANSKKMQKAVFKQQFEAFKISNSEGLEKGYDRFQQLLSQLEAHGAEVSTEDANHKFLRSLPPAWSNLAMTMRTNPEIDTLSIDDLYNNLRVFEQEIQGASKTSSSAQNVAFVSQSKSSTNKVKSGFTGAYSTCTPSTSSTNIPERSS
ncbi:integrase, catalytic region, zinc finger, CCHC-type containing protein [Tanacetum coccineum]